MVLTLGGGPRATTLEVAIYQALRLDVDLPRGGALALLQTIACLVMVAVAWITGRRLDFGRGTRLIGARFDGMALGARLRDFATIALAMGFVGLPVAALVFDGLRGLLFARQNGSALLAGLRGHPCARASFRGDRDLAWLSDRGRRGSPAGFEGRRSILIGIAGLAGVIASPMAVGAGITLWLTGRVDLFCLRSGRGHCHECAADLALCGGRAAARGRAQPLRKSIGSVPASASKAGIAFAWWIGRCCVRRSASALGLTVAASMGDLAAIALFGNQDLTNLTLAALQSDCRLSHGFRFGHGFGPAGALPGELRRDRTRSGGPWPFLRSKASPSPMKN